MKSIINKESEVRSCHTNDEYQFGNTLAEYRLLAGFSRGQVATALAVSAKAVEHWELGLALPTEAHLTALLHLYAQIVPQDKLKLLWDQASSKHEFHPSLRFRKSFGEIWQISSKTDMMPDSFFWSALPQIPAFFNRASEMQQMAEWIAGENHMLIVLGLGGIGKTVFAIEVARSLSFKFSKILWTSLQNAPSTDAGFAELIADAIRLISDMKITTNNQDIERNLTLLLRLLQEYRCLLIFDNLESILAQRVESGYRAGFESYQMLFDKLCTTTHKSCVLLTSREMPDHLVQLAIRWPIQAILLDRLDVDPLRSMLFSRISGDQQQWQQLADDYYGNPLVLELVAAEIQEMFAGDIGAYLKSGSPVGMKFQAVIGRQFEHLSEEERSLLYRLATACEPVSFDELLLHPLPASFHTTMRQLLRALHRKKFLLSQDKGTFFSLHPLIREFVMSRLMDILAEEVATGHISYLDDYALVNARKREITRDNQIHFNLIPLLDLLRTRYNEQKLQEVLVAVLDSLRLIPLERQRYAPGNIMNLLICKQTFEHVDASNLRIRHALLDQSNAQYVNLRRSDVSDSTFRWAFASISSVAIRQDGLIAVGSFDGRITLLRKMTGSDLYEPFLVLPGHQQMTWSVAFDTSGHLLASSGYDGSVRIWHVATGRCLHHLKGHKQWVWTLSFHPDGSSLVSGSSDGTLRVWDTRTGDCTQTLQTETEISSVAFNHAGSLLASGGRGQITIWNATTWKPDVVLQAHDEKIVRSCAWSPDGGLLASAGEDGSVHVYWTKTWQLRTCLRGHTLHAWKVEFLSEQFLVSLSFSEWKLWQIPLERAQAIRCLHTIPVSDRLWAMAVHAPTKTILTGSHQGQLQLWSIHGQREESYQGYSWFLSALAFLNDEQVVSGDNNGFLSLWNLQTQKCLLTFEACNGRIHALDWSPDGLLLASGGDDSICKLFGHFQDDFVPLIGHTGDIFTVAFSPDGLLLASGSYDDTVRIWNLQTMTCLQILEHTSWPWTLAWSPDGSQLATGEFAGEVKLWQVQTGVCVQTICEEAHHSIVALAFRPDGRTLLSMQAGANLISSFSLQTGEVTHPIQEKADMLWIQSAAFSRDGSLLAVGCADQYLRIWNTDSGTCLHTFGPLSQIWSIAFNHSGSLLAYGDEDQRITIWDTDSEQQIAVLEKNRHYEHMNITDTTGLTQAQRAALFSFGAEEQDSSELQL